MKAFIAIDHTVADHHKQQDFDTLGEAQTHVNDNLPNGFAAPNPGGNAAYWVVNHASETLVYDSVADIAETEARRIELARNITFDDFEARFAVQEWDDATDYVYEADTTTGKPKRRALVQGLARAQARNSVDLLDAKTDAFLTLLVNGGVITEARKTVILTP